MHIFDPPLVTRDEDSQYYIIECDGAPVGGFYVTEVVEASQPWRDVLRTDGPLPDFRPLLKHGRILRAHHMIVEPAFRKGATWFSVANAGIARLQQRSDVGHFMVPAILPWRPYRLYSFLGLRYWSPPFVARHRPFDVPGNPPNTILMAMPLNEAAARDFVAFDITTEQLDALTYPNAPVA